jgi:hypothetical protein
MAEDHKQDSRSTDTDPTIRIRFRASGCPQAFLLCAGRHLQIWQENSPLAICTHSAGYVVDEF